MGARVRPFESKDAAEIVRIHRLSANWFEEKDLTREFVHSMAGRPDFRFFVAENNGITLGFCGVLYHENVGRAEVGPIAVDPAFAGAGAGEKLLGYAITFLAEKKIRRVVARVKEGNTHAQEFFQKQGFKKEALLERFTKESENAVQYVRFI
jgi:ribosomal protein S18 acetylase RimI-like enzyme